VKNKNKDEFVHQLDQPLKRTSLFMDAVKRLRKNKMAVAGLIVVVIYAVISLSAPFLPIHSYKFQVLDHRFLPPSFKSAGKILLDKEKTRLFDQAKEAGRDNLLPEELQKLDEYKQKLKSETITIDGKQERTHERMYLLGTDSLGRDLLARIIYGGQVSIAIGLIGSITSVLIGTCIGAIAGYMGGKLDYIITRIIDIMYSLPYMMLVIIFMSLFGRGILNLFLALAFVSWLTVARVVRGQIISLKNSEFVEAARSIGAGNFRIVFKHLIPNTLGIIVVFTTLTIPSFIMMEAFLSFLGLGVQAPFATWGSLIQESIDGMNLFPWRLFFPAITMVMFLFAMNFFGDGLRDALDPQLKNKL
jgi:oligopeptide transport system permease protein